MGLRPAKCYKRHKRAYTRVSIRRPRKSYVKGVPVPKIHRFEMGNKKKTFPVTLYLVAKQAVNIRSNAMEAARISITKALEKAGPENYFIKILPFPHQVMRENPLATGAGADRFQSGMKKSFGKPIGKSARIKPGKALFTIYFEKPHMAAAKEALRKATSKFPIPCYTEVEEIK